MVKSDLMDTITDSSCGSAANRSNVYVSEKNNKIFPVPKTLQGISTSAETKEERSKKKDQHFKYNFVQN
jgi:hypothetical protein